jgi:hypothetical protein
LPAAVFALTRFRLHKHTIASTASAQVKTITHPTNAPIALALCLSLLLPLVPVDAGLVPGARSADTSGEGSGAMLRGAGTVETFSLAGGVFSLAALSCFTQAQT